MALIVISIRDRVVNDTIGFEVRITRMVEESRPIPISTRCDPPSIVGVKPIEVVGIIIVG